MDQPLGGLILQHSVWLKSQEIEKDDCRYVEIIFTKVPCSPDYPMGKSRRARSFSGHLLKNQQLKKAVVTNWQYLSHNS
jgi:hypothetical protein